jgi:hypothetical protein
MSTAQDLITDAYRELNVTPIGITPDAAQLAEGLNQLNRFLRIIYGLKMGELLIDWEVPFQQRTAPVAANFPQNPYPLNQDAQFMGLPLSGGAGNMFWPYPPKNSRLIIGGLVAPTTVYFPEQPDDGSRMGLIQGGLANAGITITLDGNSRTINGAPTQAVTTPLTAARWIYRADIGDWQPMADLALADTSPFPEDMDDYISLGLAIRLAPKNDKTVSPETAMAFKNAETIFEARYKQSGTTVYKSADIPLGSESFLTRYWI